MASLAGDVNHFNRSQDRNRGDGRRPPAYESQEFLAQPLQKIRRLVPRV